MSEKPMSETTFLKKIEQESGENVSVCFQCRKCSNGCPVVFAMDNPPHRMMRMVQMGMKKELLEGNTIWVCATCETCATRCPNDIEIATVMDTLRHMYRRDKVRGKEYKMPIFHQVFLNSIKVTGRVFELGMVAQYKLKTKDYFQDAKLGWEMFKKGKLKMFPHTVKKMAEIRKIFTESARKG